MSTTTTATGFDPVVQRERALQKANRIRVRRGEAKRAVAAGDVTATTVLTSMAAEVAGMRVLDLLLSIRAVGVSKTDVVLRRVGIAPTKRIGELTARQRHALIAWLDGR